MSTREVVWCGNEDHGHPTPAILLEAPDMENSGVMAEPMSSAPVWPAALVVGILLGFIALFTILAAFRASEPAYGPVPSPAPAPGPVLLEAGGQR